MYIYCLVIDLSFNNFCCGKRVYRITGTYYIFQ